MAADKYLLLAMDVGAGTTDILLWSEDMLPANCPRMVVPSASVLVAQEVDEIASRGKNIHLEGFLMGGGPSSKAVRRALKKGIFVTATTEAALTLSDNLDRVAEMGVEIREETPDGAVPVVMGDVDLEMVKDSFRPWNIEIPENVAVAVQDHGHSPHDSNRTFRFKHWKKIMDSGSRLEDLYPPDPPEYMTRMLSVQKQVPGALVMDTGPAAVLGALDDDEIAEAVSGSGSVVINFGNAHTIAFLIRGDRLFGLFEHHTRSLNGEKLKTMVRRLQSGELTNEEVFKEGGHGAIYSPDFKPGGFEFIAATGPRRSAAKGFARFAAPHGDMMLTGAFGLARAWKALNL